MATRRLADMSPEELKEHRRAIYKRYHQSEKHNVTRRKSEYQKRYGITLDDYEAMCEAQKGVCKICGNKETHKGALGRTKPLCVDHCHATGKVRGLLCNDCNVLLGRAKDNVTVLESAINYLKEN
jgi:hypothetical protein